MSRRLAVSLALAALLPAATAGCGGEPTIDVPGGDAGRAPTLIKAYGCGACHTIPGIRGADAEIGPPLEDMAERRTIAGVLPNTPQNLIRWLEDPQAVSPGTVMPKLGVGELQAQDLAAYLYSH